MVILQIWCMWLYLFNFSIDNENDVWVGTTKGGYYLTDYSFDLNPNSFKGKWKYYYGSRWLPYTNAESNQTVISMDVTVDNGEKAVLLGTVLLYL